MINCTVYIACKMTGRDRVQMIKRADFVCETLKSRGLDSISPVLEEGVEEKPGLLLQRSNERLKSYWKRDKDLITYKAHVILCDDAHLKSLGVEREFAYARYCLWKPVITILPPDQGPNIACYEDDSVVQTIESAALIIRRKWGTPYKRMKWRIKMLIRTLPKWLWRQLVQWR